ncbi:globin-like protein [Fomes fomentarius]|nr:globin-like protein [Fomes fomentarius]
MAENIETGADLPHPSPLTAEQRKLAAATVPVLAEHGLAITTRMYSQMLAAHPELQNIFSRTKQVRGHQPEIIARSIYAYASHIEDLTPILPFVERIAHKHASVHIQPSHYAAVGEYLMKAITDIVGADTFKGHLYDAWGVAYWNLAHTFIGLERKLYEAAAWVGWHDFIVEKKVKESDEITSFYFRPKDGQALEPYRPGQYISIQRFIPQLDTPSDAASPASTHTRSRGTSTTRGTSIPAGCRISSAPLVLLSAGVGVTPLLSMLNTLVRVEGPKRQISWVQAVRNGRVHAFKAHVIVLPEHIGLDGLRVKHRRFDMVRILLRDRRDVQGRLDLEIQMNDRKSGPQLKRPRPVW